ncbi:MAG: hypothetical protein K2L34_00850, partial [Muribaculaceae bacterium]|nr:hypothetical protein [Muribaculaceae bacterium]
MTEQEMFQPRDLANAEPLKFKKRISAKSDDYEIGCEVVAWVRNSDPDNQKASDNFQLIEMTSEHESSDQDEAAVPNATIEDLDADTIKLYLISRFAPVFKGKKIDEFNMKDYSLDAMANFVINGTTIEKLLRNLRFIRPDGSVTVAAMLLFGKYTQRWLPMMTAKCISFQGNSVGGTRFRDKMHDMEIEGNLLHQFHTIMNFFIRNLRKVETKKEFNSIEQLEIPYETLTEYVVNALVHRSLNIKAPIRIFIFDDRVEIHSPGTLPNGLTISDIKNGTSMPRNIFLFSNANHLLPYTGVGSGVRRALECDPDAIFSNGIDSKENTNSVNEFLITLPRKIVEAQSQIEQDTPTHTSYYDGQIDEQDTLTFNNQKFSEQAIPTHNLSAISNEQAANTRLFSPAELKNEQVVDMPKSRQQNPYTEQITSNNVQSSNEQAYYAQTRSNSPTEQAIATPKPESSESTFEQAITSQQNIDTQSPNRQAINPYTYNHIGLPSGQVVYSSMYSYMDAINEQATNISNHNHPEVINEQANSYSIYGQVEPRNEQPELKLSKKQKVI